MFQENKYKTEFINSKIKDTELTTVYRIGDFVDLCTGPHIEHTGQIKAFKLLKHSSSYWLGDSTKDSLQRIYAISFQEKA
jgi:threonyl-tRNA synthetase